MRHLSILAVTLLVVAACTAGPGPRSPTPAVVSTALATPVAATPVPTRATTAPSSARPSPATDAPPSVEPAEPDPARFLQTCRAAPRGPEPPIPCEDAVTTALAALAVADPTRVDVRYACAGAPGCTAPDVDRAFVTVLAGGEADGGATEVEITRDAGGIIEAAGTRPGRLPAPPAFSPPPAGRATIPGAPARLLARSAVPLCGQEDTPMGGPYDEVARRCFLDGVLAGSPVEFASIGAGTEGQPYVLLFRYAGGGGIESVTGEGSQWSRSFTGIREAPGGLVFDVGGISTPPEPVP